MLKLSYHGNAIRLFIYGCALVLGAIPMRLFAQTPAPADPDALKVRVITYDMATNRFDKVFPFDQDFLIHIKGIKPEYNRLRFTITSSNGTIDATKPIPRRVTPANLAKAYPELGLDDWERPVGGTAITETDVYVPYHLKYNKSYQFIAEPFGTRPLNPDEKQRLSRALQTDPAIAAAINSLAHATEEQPENIIARYKDDINAAAREAVKHVDSTFIFKQPENLPQLVRLNTFKQSLNNIDAAITNLRQSAAADTDKVKNLQVTVTNLDWGNADTTSAAFGLFTADVMSLTRAGEKPDAAFSLMQKGIRNRIKDAITARDKLKDELIGTIVVPYTSKIVTLNATYRSEFVDNAGFYITVDLGLAYVWRVDRGMAYTGANFYFRPIDKNVPFSNYHTFAEQMGVRTSILIGITFASIEKTDVRKGFIDSKALVLGGGFRILPFLRVNGGVFCHYRNEMNPAIDPARYHFSTSPFVSLSFDMDIKPLFKGIGDSLFK